MGKLVFHAFCVLDLLIRCFGFGLKWEPLAVQCKPAHHGKASVSRILCIGSAKQVFWHTTSSCAMKPSSFGRLRENSLVLLVAMQ